MSPRPSLPALVLVAGLMLTAGRASAQLTVHSPFQPLPSSLPAAAVESTLKYGGYIETSEGTQYRFTDSARKAAAFIRLNQRDEALGLTVKQHDRKNQTVTVDYQGRTLTLAEPRMKILTSGVVRAGAPGSIPVVPPPTTAPVNLSPQDEQRRLETVAAEIAQRRAAREQAAAGTPPAQR